MVLLCAPFILHLFHYFTDCGHLTMVLYMFPLLTFVVWIMNIGPIILCGLHVGYFGSLVIGLTVHVNYIKS